MPISNWAGNVHFTAREVARPRSVPELQRAVSGATAVRALGTGHSFSAIADSPGLLVSLRDLPRVVDVDTARSRVRIDGGIRYGDLAAALQGSGLALRNLGSLPHISVAGSCATGTHGAGADNQVLAAAVRALTLVTADGDLLRVDAETTPDFAGFVISLGRLGVVVDLQLDVVPAFDLAQTVVDDVPEEALADQLPRVLGAAYSASIFTDWGARRRCQLWLKERVGREGAWTGEHLWGGRAADGPRHPVPGMPTEFATVQQGVPGAWHERLPHFRMEFTPSSGEELQTEYLVPARRAGEAWRAVSALRHLVAPVLQISELRAVAADQLWLSPTGGEAAVAFHFTWVADGASVLPVVRALEEQLGGLEARPHWGKLFSTGPANLASLYPRLGGFRELAGALDPRGKLGNGLVDAWLGLDGPTAARGAATR